MRKYIIRVAYVDEIRVYEVNSFHSLNLSITNEVNYYILTH